jgi:hypothetical protein
MYPIAQPPADFEILSVKSSRHPEPNFSQFPFLCIRSHGYQSSHFSEPRQIRRGEQLEDRKTLQHFGLQKDSTVHLVLCPRRGPTDESTPFIESTVSK